MATQSIPLPDRLVLTENQFEQLQQLASTQNISISEALARAIQVSKVVVRNLQEPGAKVLFKHGKHYKELVTNWS